MLRDVDDPVVAASLIRFIEALIRDGSLDRAAKAAGLDVHAARKFLDAIKGELSKVGGGSPETSTVARRRGAPKLTAVSDGASRGNPGEAACAVILYDDEGEELLRRSKRLGVRTNNVAEYEGVILALDLASQLGAGELVVKLDSELVVKQLNGSYKVKHADLKPLHARARALMDGFARVAVVHVPRTETRDVDKHANAALDGKD